MARNKVQFQKGVSLNEFIQQYGTEKQCFDALFKLRWPQGFTCPACGHDKSCRMNTPPAKSRWFQIRLKAGHFA